MKASSSENLIDLANSVRLGYACISAIMQEEGVYTSRTLSLATLHKHGIDKAKELANQNLDDLWRIINYNERSGIRFYRITSNLFPHMENPRHDKNEKYDIKFAKRKLAKIGKLAKSYGHRLSMHPGQYAQLGSVNPEVVQQSFRDLKLHADILSAMGLSPTETDSVIIIHGGGHFGSKTDTLERWYEHFAKLDKYIRDFIVIENDDYIYSVEDLLPFCEKYNIPLCLDFFHDECNPSKLNPRDPKVFSRVMNIWKHRNIKPKIHISNQRPDSRLGSHSDCIENIPQDILDLCYEHSVDIMLEVKHKDKCLFRIYELQFEPHFINSRLYWTPK